MTVSNVVEFAADSPHTRAAKREAVKENQDNSTGQPPGSPLKRSIEPAMNADRCRQPEFHNFKHRKTKHQQVTVKPGQSE